MKKPQDRAGMLTDAQISAVKKVDADRYRAALIAPQAARMRLMILYAFHAELAKVPELVSEPMVGAIRYQWWRDAVGEIYDDTKSVRKHEVSTPLSDVLRHCEVSRFWVDQLIDGRERDLDPRPFDGIEAAKAYCAQTSGKLLQIAVQVAAPQFRPSAAQTDGITRAGLAWGLTGLARAYGYYHKTMLSGVSFDDLKTQTLAAYNEATNELGKIPTEIIPAIAYVGLVPKYLKRMGKGFDPLSQTVSYNPLAKHLNLMSVTLRGQL